MCLQLAIAERQGGNGDLADLDLVKVAPSDQEQQAHAVTAAEVEVSTISAVATAYCPDLRLVQLV